MLWTGRWELTLPCPALRRPESVNLPCLLAPLGYGVQGARPEAHCRLTQMLEVSVMRVAMTGTPEVNDRPLVKSVPPVGSLDTSGRSVEVPGYRMAAHYWLWLPMTVHVWLWLPGVAHNLP